MHELALCRAVVETAVGHASGRPVTRVSLRVGRLRQVIPGTLDFYFDIVARGTPCEGARLEQTLVPARLRCEACAHEWELDEPRFVCPDCASTAVEVLTGEELEVESIEVEVREEDACTAPR